MLIKFDIFRSGVMEQFNALKEYIEYVEGQIQESHHSTRTQILTENPTPPGLSEEGEVEWLSQLEQEISECDRRYAVDFRRILRFTVLMSVFTLVESNLSLLAKEIMKRKKLALAMEDLQAKNLVKRFEKFWTRVAVLPWWPDPRWDALQDVEELRNCIAHRNGVVRENDGRIKQLLSRARGVRVVELEDPMTYPDEAGTLVIDGRFCGKALGKMAALFDKIFNRAGCFGPHPGVVEAK